MLWKSAFTGNAALRHADFETRYQAVMDILKEIDKLPVLDDRTPDELLGYDEHGLPT